MIFTLIPLGCSLSGTLSAYSGGTCGLSITPVVSSDGYVVGSNSSSELPDSSGHSLVDRYVLVPMTQAYLWVETHWRVSYVSMF